MPGIPLNALRVAVRTGRVVVFPLLFVAAWALPPGLARAQAIESYKLVVTGVEDGDLRNEVEQVSELAPSKERPVATVRDLRRRAEDALPRVRALLRARGYYDSEIGYRIAPPEDGTTEATLAVTLGPLYRLTRYDIKAIAPDGRPQKVDVPLSELGLRLGEAALSEPIAASGQKLLVALANRSFPLAGIRDRRVVVDHAKHSVSVEITVATGPRARFGPSAVKGQTDVEESYVRRQIRWQAGEPFDARKVEATRSALRETGLFSTVRIEHADAVAADGTLPMTIALAERDHRSIGAGVSYTTTESYLAKLFWEHRNLFGRGEHLHLEGQYGDISKGLFGEYRVPDYLMLGQELLFDARIAEERPLGFESFETAATVRIARNFGGIHRASVGVGFDRSVVNQNGVEDAFTFLTMPLEYRRDSSDNLLDPSTGGRDQINVTPHFGLIESDANFVVGRLYDTIYRSLLPEKELVVAGWARLGMILGAGLGEIPANKRLYAGGPGSVRGYALNSVGPLNAANQPIGGRSSTEFGVELRWKAWGPVGLVAFAEGGAVYSDILPRIGEDILFGAGVGVRYHTAIGPIRLDVAFPLDRRKAIDDPFQILVSLGQAF